MVNEHTSTTVLVSIMTMLFSKTPYTIHITSLAAAIKNISIEMSFADFSFHVFITCGRKVSAVTRPAE